MATRTVVEYLCDLCGNQAEPKTHEVAVDGQQIELEACPRCWERVAKTLDGLAEAGRCQGRRKRRKASA